MLDFAGLQEEPCPEKCRPVLQNFASHHGRLRKGLAKLKYLITGGAGFIGSHLADRLTADGHEVVILDDLSTGSIGNIEHLIRSGRVEFVEGSVTEEDLMLGVLESVDSCIHLASIVGVSLVVDNPVDTLLSNVRGCDVVLSAAAGLGRPVLYASTSEVYGKHSNGALDEDADRILGPIQKCRWNYATSKSFGEALALGYAQELGAENTVVRLFNTVGPRQTGMYGMVLPRFVRQAVTGQPLTVFGDGTQTRCFSHVFDTVEALVCLLGSEEAPGRVFNIGNPAEISIMGLARRVIARSGSNSEIRFVPYSEAYDEGFEELGRRKPDTKLLRQLTGWEPNRTVDDAIDDVIMYERAGMNRIEEDAQVA
jgi:nucleoside-diphosphate-sugar epimerase